MNLQFHLLQKYLCNTSISHFFTLCKNFDVSDRCYSPFAAASAALYFLIRSAMLTFTSMLTSPFLFSV